ncbi:asparagine synthetase B family protein [Candidatus Planktophila vernalis]|uniref:asparagine synthetase B family protein n=1 Tax=Candidatus Planktophila vernalis TaxID=1884907 RepID=UPI003CE7CFFB
MSSSNSLIGFARLSIVDIEHGDQPTLFENGIIGMGNGEVYNFREIRNKLPQNAQFKTVGSDIQVALEYLLIYGNAKVIDFEGMFSLVLIDESKKKVILFRDRTGEKPLYYRYKENEITFASMESSLISSIEDNEILLDSIHTWCRYGLLPVGQTFFKDIYEVKPGTYLEFDSSVIIENRYWKWPNRGNRKFDGAFSAELDAILRDCANEFIQAEVPLAIALSSGVDSNAMNSYISDQQVKSLDSFTLGFSSENFDESKFALRNKGSKNAKQHIISFDGISHQFLSDHINEFMDAPISDPGVIAFAAICSEVSSTHKVILTGDGADELLRGYTIFKYFNLANLLMSLLHFLNPQRRKRLITMLLTKEDDGYLGIIQLFLRLLIGSLQKSEDRFAIAISNTFLHSFLMPESIEPKFNIRTKLDLERYFQEQNLPQVYLQKSDRASMAFGIEARSFFLQPKIINHFMDLSARHATKKRFRSFLEKNSRISDLPKKKHGLGVPMTKFMAEQTEPEWQTSLIGIEVEICREVWRNRGSNPAYANLAWSYLVLNSMMTNWSRLGKVHISNFERSSHEAI